ncbi:SLIT-ROBO Rho GTPase-activating protein 1 [Aplysia californica]|uniref:SLIT-ROBO Rho GTPase-activating protein 1 n=1 Tax=Aplysia californica TaxID=6500 RepID=A0ABM1W1I3_APLCA|nr:SLIT-ROBO Rho GTPase-activating protein 1 [Aplysia californica]
MLNRSVSVSTNGDDVTSLKSTVSSSSAPAATGPDVRPEHHGSSVSVVSGPIATATKVIRGHGMFSPNGRRHSKGYRDGVGTKLSIQDIRQQLNDQLKCLETKLDTEVSIVAELQEFFRRRADVELEYARNLDKLVKQMIARHKAEKPKQEQWAILSTYACWKHLLGITRKQSQDHETIAQIFSNQMVNRLGEVMDNSQRIFRKCREIGAESHEDMMKVLNELQSAMKTYHIYQNESKQAEMKLKNVECQKHKVEQQLSGKNTTSKKLKGLERQADKKQQKYSDNKLKALKARNDYLLCIDAANSAISKYFSDDISDLMDCMDFGYHNSVGRSMMMYLGIHEHQRNAHSKFVDSLNKCITDLDSRADKQKFMERNNVVFMLPKKFEFQSFKGDEVCQISAQKEVQEALVQWYTTIEDRLNSLKVENDEIWKTLETTEKTLVDTIQVRDYDITKYFADDNAPPRSPHEHAKHKSDHLETESFYLTKFREYTLSCNRLARLQSKHSAIQKAIGENELSGTARPPAPPPKPKKRRIGHTPRVGQPKLFGGSLEEYIEATSQEIPLLIKSCIRVINLYGLHHQGVFRVSGAQVEINQFKTTFESGEDALADIVDASDINSVAGVLKLYFRELREPLFPLHLFDALVECTREKEMSKRVERIKDLLSGVNRAIFVVMRYLFAFLNHLTEYSDENMMDPYNLAICFGPTLLPIPPDRDQVTFQASVNEIIKIIISHQEEIFPNDGGETYEKMLLDRRDSIDACEEEEDETNSIPSDEEEPDVLEATSVFDFEARSPRELSFKRGDTLVLYNQVSADWWEGCFHGKEGLIPDKYIALKNVEDTKSQHSHEEEKNLMTTSMTLPSRPARQTSDDSGLESCDKSMSQPNVAIRETDILGVDAELSPPPTPRSSTASSGVGGESPVLPPGRGESGSLAGKSSVSGGGGRKEYAKDASVLRVHNTTTTSSTDLSPILEGTEKERKEVQKKPSPAASPSSTLKSAVLSASLMSTSLVSAASKAPVKKENRDIMSIKSLDGGGGGPGGSGGKGELSTSVTSVTSPDSTSDDLSVDIDTALEEVMAGLKSLEMQQKQDKRMSLPAVKVKQTPKHTPDLVLDLPDGNGSNSSTDSAEPDSPTISAAETFAQSNQGTLKKASGGEGGEPHREMGIGSSSSVIVGGGGSHLARSMSQETSSRLSISSEPGDLARNRDGREILTFGRPVGSLMTTSQSPLSTFAISSLKRTQSAMPSPGRPIDNQSRSPAVGDLKSSPRSADVGSSSSSSLSPISITAHVPAPAPTPPIFIPPVPKSLASSGAPTTAPTMGPVPPPVAQKPKPPMKVKPPVMKKPTPPRSEVQPPP